MAISQQAVGMAERVDQFKDRIIVNDQVHERLLSKTNLTLDKVIKLLKTNKAVHFQTQDKVVPRDSMMQAINTHLQRKPEKETRELADNSDSLQKRCCNHSRGMYSEKKLACL